MKTPELREKARQLGLKITTPTKRLSRSRRYKTDAELLNEILKTPQKIRDTRHNVFLKELQMMVKNANKHMNTRNTQNTKTNNYNKKRANILLSK